MAPTPLIYQVYYIIELTTCILKVKIVATVVVMVC